MALDGITISFLAKELHEELEGTVVDKIQQPSRFDLLLTFRSRKSPRILLSANPSYPVAYKTDLSFINPQQAPMFCMLLRKHLIGAKLLGIEAPDYERVLYFHFSVRDELYDDKTRTLVVELMGRQSNIILLDENNIILDSLIHVDESKSRVREILPARHYQPVPAQEKPMIDESLEAIKNKSSQYLIELQEKYSGLRLDKLFLNLAKGYSPLVIQELLYRSELDTSDSITDLRHVKLQLVTEQAMLLMLETKQGLESGKNAYFYSESSKAAGEFHFLKLDHLGPYEEHPSLNSAISKSYSLYFSKDRISQKKNQLLSVLNREEKKKRKLLEAYIQDINESKDFEQKKVLGELITSQLYMLPKQVPDDNTIQLIDYYNEGREISVELNPRFSIQKNAEHLFRQYNRDKQTFQYAKDHLVQIQEDLNYYESLLSILENADTLEDIDAVKIEIENTFKKSGKQLAINNKKANKPKKKSDKNIEERALPPRQFTSPSGKSILVGRNNYQNDQLTLKTAQKDDFWFHAKQRPGAHVILRCEGQSPTAEDIESAAQICAFYSRSAGEKSNKIISKIDIDYCPASHVKKARGAKPGLVFYENYSTILAEAKLPIEDTE